jgi:hypothetical protein
MYLLKLKCSACTLISDGIYQLSVHQISSSVADHWNRHVMLYKGVTEKMYFVF